MLEGCTLPEPAEEEKKRDTEYAPWQSFPQLFAEVQGENILHDGKAFVDYQPVVPIEDIRSYYRSQSADTTFDLAAFVSEYFVAPPATNTHIVEGLEFAVHLDSVWAILTRPADQPSPLPSTLIPLPNPYVVPGGRFREIYYWDSYFTMQGLVASGEMDLVKSMLDNFAYLIDTLGYVPNGNRTYLATRSQPPFFSSMVMLYGEATSIKNALPYLPQLEKEYAFWMAGASDLTPAKPEGTRVVRLPDGELLNRYHGNGSGPRPESWREDSTLAASLPAEARPGLYRELRAACESGWDFSTRWFADVNDFNSIRTTRILPVDLNSLLYHLERSLAILHAEAGHPNRSIEFNQRAQDRSEAIRKYFWSEEQGYFVDFVLDGQTRSPYITAAGMFPLYFRLASNLEAQQALATWQEHLRRPGGVVATQTASHQQWDAPNGWAPLQWVSVVGLENYGFQAEARALANDWLRLNQRVYAQTGKMMEKYNVVDITLPAGGGEYPTQDGFGWTNGVALGLMKKYGQPQE